MGCLLSTPEVTGGKKRRLGTVGQVAVFLPVLRLPKSIDFSLSSSDNLPKNIEERLSSLRTHMILMASKEFHRAVKPRRRKARKHGGSSLAERLQVADHYLSVLLGLVKEEKELEEKVQFVWVNHEDEEEETMMENGWYEVLSVLHLMAMLCLSEANFVLLPRYATDGRQTAVSEENMLISIDILLKAAGYLDYAVRNVLPQIPPSTRYSDYSSDETLQTDSSINGRRHLPVDLKEGVLLALCWQALGQCAGIQLGMAINSPKATLAVKRRLACEMVKYWQQAQDSLSQTAFTACWGKKHDLFVKWKYVEATACAYYYHGLILDEGNTEKSHIMAVTALEASENCLRESKKASAAFHASEPVSRSPLPWGFMKYLSERISKDASNKVHINQDLYSAQKILSRPPVLPDFVLALKPDEFELPSLDPIWIQRNHKP